MPDSEAASQPAVLSPAGEKAEAFVGAPVIESVGAAVYVIPTDAPEADGTLAWDKTTMVLATAGPAAWTASAGHMLPGRRRPWSRTCWPVP